MSPLGWTALAALGGLGAVARFRLDGFVQQRVPGDFPAGTLAVNCAGSFALGLLAGAGVVDGAMSVLGVGFLGSFTTFSTWMLETQRLGEEGDDRTALLNVVVPLAAGLAAAALGWTLGASA